MASLNTIADGEVAAVDSCTQVLVDLKAYHTNSKHCLAFEKVPRHRQVGGFHMDFGVKRDSGADHTAGREVVDHRSLVHVVVVPVD